MRHSTGGVLSVLLLTVSIVIPAAGQGPASKSSDLRKKDLVDRIKEKKRFAPKEVGQVFSYTGDGGELYMLVLGLKLVVPNTIIATEETRVDEQVGSGSMGSGSTALVSKGSVPTILGLAVENGALMRSKSGTTITFRGNPVGIMNALARKGYVESYDPDEKFIQHLRKLSFALSFDTNRGDSMGIFTGDRQQLASYSFRYDIYNRRDPRHSTYATKWRELAENYGVRIAAAAREFSYLFESGPKAEPDLVSWYKTALQAVKDADEKQVQEVVDRQLKLLQDIAPRLREDTKLLIQRFVKDLDKLLSAREDVLEVVSNGLILTFEYTNIREVAAPDKSNFKVILEGSPRSGKFDLAANVGLTILNSKPEGMDIDRVQSFELSGQLDIPFGGGKGKWNPVLSFAGMYERMMENAIMPGGMMMPDTKGDIGIGQIKLTIPLTGTGVKMPLSITYANRTELIKEEEVRGNIGVTFDLDSLFARTNP